jgi:hypothetical protein
MTSVPDFYALIDADGKGGLPIILGGFQLWNKGSDINLLLCSKNFWQFPLRKNCNFKLKFCLCSAILWSVYFNQQERRKNSKTKKLLITTTI